MQSFRALSPSAIRRTSLWYMSMFGWVFIAFVNILLVGQQTGPPPNVYYCLAQASLVYSSTAYSAMTFAAYMTQTYCSIASPELKHLSNRPLFVALLHIIPSLVFVAIVLEILIVGLKQKNLIEREPYGMYCHLQTSTPAHVTAGVILIGMSIVLVFELLIFRLIRQTSQGVRSVSRNSMSVAQESFSREIFIRMAVFSTWAFICVGLSSIQYLPDTMSVDYAKVQIVQATLPCIATLTVGTQRDVMNTCLKRRKFFESRTEL
ncbi:hypothetical protein JR316_0013093 [Psilocybe cubensis]|uniref:Uncharacterized protein n=1 Tax=Psilocybe cubensis TaxID=181762 RepID=A0ACB8GGM0_PSICU|nr:hypothetical protein JR316_0013093 [Psilocybe cubensis]KAH9474629.1 hypothetical protein JR316_0013093 [Psilocybe cubensis]